MTALRYAYVLALVVWLGGMFTIAAIVAPATFAAMEHREGAAGRSTAATVVGEVLRRFHVVSYAAGAVLLITLVAMKIVGPRPPGFGARLAVVGGMLLLSVIGGELVDARIARLRDAIGVPVASLPTDDARRAEFGRLHAVSTALFGAAALGGLALCYWETRE
jgi:hypothetical protein